MAQKTVNHNGESYLIENAIGTLLCVTLDYGNGKTKTATIRNIGLELDESQDEGSRGVAFSTVRIEAIDPLGNESSDRRFEGVFDESKVNATGFGNLLKRTIINDIFKQLLDIEPLNMDGTVKPEFQ